jgi:hypothetical protein
MPELGTELGRWSSTPPAAPGRYWWRAVDKIGRPSYGLILVKWIQIGAEWEPELRVVSQSNFSNGYFGETEKNEGWSSGGGMKVSEFPRHYPGVEFWSEPERGPENFLPDLPGKPEWTPRDPVAVEAERKKRAEESAKRQQEEVDERTEKIAEAKASGYTLYECEQCEELYTEDELVQVRECPHCDDAKFNGTEEGQNCPSCNRKFTRNITEKGCPECLDDECPVLAETAPTSEFEPVSKKGRKKK